MQISESLASIDSNDFEPSPTPLPITCEYFRVEKLTVNGTLAGKCDGTSFHILTGIAGKLAVNSESLGVGEFYCCRQRWGLMRLPATVQCCGQRSRYVQLLDVFHAFDDSLILQPEDFLTFRFRLWYIRQALPRERVQTALFHGAKQKRRDDCRVIRRRLNAERAAPEFGTEAFVLRDAERRDVAVADFDVDAFQWRFVRKNPERFHQIDAALAEWDADNHRLAFNLDHKMIFEVCADCVRRHIRDRFDGIFPDHHRVAGVDMRADILTVHLPDDGQDIVRGFVFVVFVGDPYAAIGTHRQHLAEVEDGLLDCSAGSNNVSSTLRGVSYKQRRVGWSGRCERWLPLVRRAPLYDYFRYIGAWPLPQLHEMVLYQLLAPVTRYLSKPELERWFSDGRFASHEITQFNGMSWRAHGILKGDDGASLHIGDLVDGICRCIGRPKAINQVFNLTCGQGRSLNEMAAIIQQEFPGIKVSRVERDALMPERGTLSVDKARAHIGYEPAHPLEKVYRKYIQWYRGLFDRIQATPRVTAGSQVNE